MKLELKCYQVHPGHIGLEVGGQSIVCDILQQLYNSCNDGKLGGCDLYSGKYLLWVMIISNANTSGLLTLIVSASL